MTDNKLSTVHVKNGWMNEQLKYSPIITLAFHGRWQITTELDREKRGFRNQLALLLRIPGLVILKPK